MKKVLKSLIFLALVATIVGACAPARHSGSTSPAAQGTGDGGGGNLCQGRALESYVKPVEELEAFKLHVLPTLNKIGKDSDAYRFITHALNKKWFFIPCPITKISEARLGTPTVTDQGAVQTFREVYVSEAEFKKLLEGIDGAKNRAVGLKDQGDLIWHELFMGLRLLKYDSNHNQCMAHTGGNEALCEKNSYTTKPRGRESQLTKEDYADIRQATAEVQSVEIPANEIWRGLVWEDFLGRLRFDLENRRFTRRNDIRPFTIEEFSKVLSRTIYSERLPSESRLGKCNVDLKLSEDQKTFEIELEGPKFPKVRVSYDLTIYNGNGAIGPFQINLNAETTSRSLYNLAFIEKNQFSRQTGEHWFDVSMILDPSGVVEAVNATEMVATNCKRDERNGISNCESYSPANSKRLRCAASAELAKTLGN